MTEINLISAFVVGLLGDPLQRGQLVVEPLPSRIEVEVPDTIAVGDLANPGDHGGRSAAGRRVQLAELLAQLVARALRRGPVEAHLAGLVLHALGREQRLDVDVLRGQAAPQHIVRVAHQFDPHAVKVGVDLVGRGVVHPGHVMPGIRGDRAGPAHAARQMGAAAATPAA